MKKICFMMLAGFLTVHAAQLIYPNGQTEYFTKAVTKQRALHEQRYYYKNGIKDRKHRYLDTRRIFVSFGGKRELKKFMQRYSLSFIKVVNPYFYTVLFHVDSDADVITLCSEINLNEKVRYARPNWRAPRILR